MLIKCIGDLGAASGMCVLQLDWGWNPYQIQPLYLTFRGIWTLAVLCFGLVSSFAR